MKRCDMCNTELIIGVTARTAWAKRCVIIDSTELSPCQKTKNRETAAIARKRQKEKDRSDQYEQFKLPKFNNDQEAMRVCLRCPEGAPKFLSKSIGNRTCPSCSKAVPIVDTSGLANITGNSGSYDFILPEIFKIKKGEKLWE